MRLTVFISQVQIHFDTVSYANNRQDRSPENKAPVQNTVTEGVQILLGVEMLCTRGMDTQGFSALHNTNRFVLVQLQRLPCRDTYYTQYGSANTNTTGTYTFAFLNGDTYVYWKCKHI